MPKTPHQVIVPRSATGPFGQCVNVAAHGHRPALGPVDRIEGNERALAAFGQQLTQRFAFERLALGARSEQIEPQPNHRADADIAPLGYQRPCECGLLVGQRDR